MALEASQRCPLAGGRGAKGAKAQHAEHASTVVSLPVRPVVSAELLKILQSEVSETGLMDPAGRQSKANLPGRFLPCLQPLARQTLRATALKSKVQMRGAK